MQHQEYPKYMSHPGYRPAQIGQEVKSTTSVSGMTIGVTASTPLAFPPVVVHGEDDEAYYVSKGYVSQAQSDPGAFMRAHSVAPATANYQPAEYPKWIGEALVNNEDEELALMEPAQAEPEPETEPVRRRK